MESPRQGLGMGSWSIPTPSSQPYTYLFTVLTFVLFAYVLKPQKTLDLPELNPKKPFELTNKRRVIEFVFGSKDLLIQGRAKYRNEPYKAFSEFGEVVVVPPEFVDELRSDPRLESLETANSENMGYIPGFDPFKTVHDLSKLATEYLTTALVKLSAPVSEEASLAIHDLIGDSPEWREIGTREDVTQIVGRISSRVFMGEEMCRDPEWVKVSGEYAQLVLQLQGFVRALPASIRPIIHWFMPSCWELRRKLKQTRQLLNAHIKRREARKAEAAAKGEENPYDDSIEWFEKYCGKAYDPASSQILLILAAILTTSDVLSQVLIDIAKHPELVAPLREEVITVLSVEGWKKSGLFKLKLMDSLIKESLRLKPLFLGAFRRMTMDNIQLQNGYVIPKGTRVVTDTTHMWNNSHWDNAETYDAYRFLRLREEPGNDTKTQQQAHLVSTSVSHLGFGHGQHACPGRFFAANEIKIILCHLLLKYDWKLPEGADPKPVSFGMTQIADPTARILFKRRKEEMELEKLKYY